MSFIKSWLTGNRNLSTTSTSSGTSSVASSNAPSPIPNGTTTNSIGGTHGLPPAAVSGVHQDWMTLGKERYFGFENFGNTCYCNSVLQALYFCKPFRDQVLSYSPTSLANTYLQSSALTRYRQSRSPSPITPATSKNSSNTASSSIPPANPPIGKESKSIHDLAESLAKQDSLLTSLKDLFTKITTHKKRHGIIPPQAFVNMLKKENELFRSTMHQDAHEFLNVLLNSLVETLEKHDKELRKEIEKVYGEGCLEGIKVNGNGNSSNNSNTQIPTWVHRLFEGVLVNETKCSACQTVTSRYESFLDLSIDIEPNTSLNACLKNFSSIEVLNGHNKFFCDTCRSLQDAQKLMKIKTPPNILAIHLKRFKYQERLQRYTKLSHRILFSHELRLFNTCDSEDEDEDSENIDSSTGNNTNILTTKDKSDRLYTLFAIVVHLGSGPYHGHYVTLVHLPLHTNPPSKQWVLFDDDHVEAIDDAVLWKYIGGADWGPTQPPNDGCVGTGYLFFYQAEGV